MNVNKARIKILDDRCFKEIVEIEGPQLSLEILKRSITTRSVSRIGSSWDVYYGLLLAYKDRKDHCNVTVNEDASLGGWAVMQRIYRRKGKLTERQIQMLDSIGFDWNYQKTKGEDTWNKHYSRLKVYKKIHGDCNVPRTYKEDSKLASWVWIQRGEYRKGDTERKLTNEQIRLLEEIGFAWNVRGDKWHRKFEELKQFKTVNGHCLIPKTVPEYEELAGWVQSQKQRKIKGEITEEQLKLLENIGLWQTAKIDRKWLDKYEELKKYKETHGHCDVPSKWKGNPELANWVAAQRQFRKQGKLEQIRIDELDKIGFGWSFRERGTWENHFEELVDFKKKYGHCNVLQGGESLNLGRWVSMQRSQRRHNRLDEVRISKLDGIGFEWESSS